MRKRCEILLRPNCALHRKSMFAKSRCPDRTYNLHVYDDPKTGAPHTNSLRRFKSKLYWGIMDSTDPRRWTRKRGRTTNMGSGKYTSAEHATSRRFWSLFQGSDFTRRAQFCRLRFCRRYGPRYDIETR